MNISALYTFFNPACTEQERNLFIALPLDQKIGRAISSLFQTIWNALSQSFIIPQNVTLSDNTSTATQKTHTLASKRLLPLPKKTFLKKHVSA